MALSCGNPNQRLWPRPHADVNARDHAAELVAATLAGAFVQ